MRVKICGITSLHDAEAAVASGADLLGFNFYPASPRSLTPERAREIIQALRSSTDGVRMVGVFVNHSVPEVQRLMAFCGLDLAQLSGDEPPQALHALAAYKAIRPADLAEARQQAERFSRSEAAPALLLDARLRGYYGGTGKTADWELAAELAGQLPLLLAGGLKPENLAQALERVHPWGVDVASGIESEPGIKDPQCMADFIQIAKSFSGAAS